MNEQQGQSEVQQVQQSTLINGVVHYPPSETARRLGVQPYTLTYNRSVGKIEGTMWNGTYYYSDAQIEAARKNMAKRKPGPKPRKGREMQNGEIQNKSQGSSRLMDKEGPSVAPKRLGYKDLQPVGA